MHTTLTNTTQDGLQTLPTFAGIATRIQDVACNIDDKGRLWASYAQITKLLRLVYHNTYKGSFFGGINTVFPMMQKGPRAEWKRTTPIWIINTEGIIELIEKFITNISRAQINKVYALLEEAEVLWPGCSGDAGSIIKNKETLYINTLPTVGVYPVGYHGKLKVANKNGNIWFALDDCKELLKITEREIGSDLLLPEEMTEIVIEANERLSLPMVSLTGFLTLLQTYGAKDFVLEIRRWLSNKFLPIALSLRENEGGEYTVPHYFNPCIATQLLFQSENGEKDLPEISIGDLVDTANVIVEYFKTEWLITEVTMWDMINERINLTFGEKRIYPAKGASWAEMIEKDEWYAASIAFISCMIKSGAKPEHACQGKAAKAMLRVYNYYQNSWGVTPEWALGTTNTQTYILKEESNDLLNR